MYEYTYLYSAPQLFSAPRWARHLSKRAARKFALIWAGRRRRRRCRHCLRAPVLYWFVIISVDAIKVIGNSSQNFLGGSNSAAVNCCCYCVFVRGGTWNMILTSIRVALRDLCNIQNHKSSYWHIQTPSPGGSNVLQ